ncbi:MAG: hypothetical protein LBM25_07585 [Bacteroidales bacterium]|jgi:hypothetical protein|nr:hypothetical protein [Bacteroidales bacterium]
MKTNQKNLFVFISINNILIYLLIIASILTACVDKSHLENNNNENNSNGNSNNPTEQTPLYVYPFSQEIKSIESQITITTKPNTSLDDITLSIPPLKYNKSFLFFLIQDDCVQSAFCRTWASINQKPLTDKYYYDIRHIFAQDLPPDYYTLDKTLGIDDGTGNEVRFHFTTTVFPEDGPKSTEMFNSPTEVNPGFTENYFRFYLKNYCIWDNVIEMVNYGNSIAFHDVVGPLTQSSIYEHLLICQDSIKQNLSQRGAKVLAEPNGNMDYYYAGLNVEDIKIMTGQGNATGVIYPFSETTELNKAFIKRDFINPDQTKIKINSELSKPKEERKAVLVGVHGTNNTWSDFLLWLNDNYGKDGDNSLWMPSLEEYYEYNYYRQNANITKNVINDTTIQINISIPMENNFYYPSFTLNIEGINMDNLSNISSNDNVKGLSYNNYDGNLMINIDCRKFLYEHALHYVEQYENQKTQSNKRDAQYFISFLKPSPEKDQLLDRVK